MMEQKQVFTLFAPLFAYPDTGYAGALSRCGGRLEADHPRAAERLQSLKDASADLRSLEELYTRTFDLQPRCCPYVGYQLFGESRERTLFLLKLREIYRAHGFKEESELPDHLGMVLQFLAIMPEGREREDIVRDGLLPALEKMIAAFEIEPQHPYAGLLDALKEVLSQENQGAAEGRREVAQ